MKNVENVKLSQDEKTLVVDLAHKVNAELTPEKLAELVGESASGEEDCFVDYHEKIDNLKLSAKGVSCMNGQTAGQIRAALLSVALAGGGIACGIIAVKKMKKRTIQKGSSVSDLADAFARVAWLPMFAQASELCARSPQSREAMLQYVQKTLGDWGYSESYVQNQFDEAMAEPRDALAARYDAYMGKLKAGEVDEFDVSPEELPAAAVGKFAVEFRDGFQSCLMASAA